MTDQEFLRWLHERMEKVYGESPYTDFMRKLKAIADITPSGIDTRPR